MKARTLFLALAVAACGGEPVKLAQKAEKLEIEAPKSAGSQRFAVDSASSRLGFDMEAPIEKIRGKVPPSALTGEVFIDLTDITKTTGLVHVDLAELELFQRVAPAEGQEFGEEKKEPKQNEHARAWLEIGPDTPPEQLAKNQKIEFSLAKITDASATDITKIAGNERTVKFTAEGEFLLHQRKASKSVKLEAVFKFAGDKATEVTIKSLEPLEIGLDEYDVRPREGFGKLAQKTLSALSPKVAKFAQVSLEFTAKPTADAKPTMTSGAAGAAPATPSEPAPDAKAPDAKAPAY
ncbi:MAG: hypothetical protein JNL82_05130 [Myxococcales bacterium]|nr:hypothetical protein [Myxococcales bacterium]